MAELINRNAASGFSFGLVEVALYGLDDGGLIVQPRTIAKTKILHRTVVLVRDEDSNMTVKPEEDEFNGLNLHGVHSPANELGESPKQAEYRAWWTPVMEAEYDDPDQEPPKLHFPNNVRMPLPTPKTWLLGYRYGGAKGYIGVCLSGNLPELNQLMDQLQKDKEEILAELPARSVYRSSSDGRAHMFTIEAKAEDFTSESAKRDWLIKILNAYVNVLRPRIKRLVTD